MELASEKATMDETQSKRQAVRIFSLMHKVDRSGLREDFEEWPRLAADSWDSEVPVASKEAPRSILVAGMGGSGIIGEILCDLFLETNSTIQLRTIKDYHLPRDVDPSSIIIGVSSSGNTEETLSVLHEAADRGLSGHTFGSGGLIEDFSKKNRRFSFTRTSKLKVPRTSLPAMLFPVLKLLIQSKVLPIKISDVKESIEILEKSRKNAGRFSAGESNTPYSIGRDLSRPHALPLIYSSKRTRAVGLRFRQSLNENAKLHSFDGVVPELCHNDIVGWDSGATRVIKGAKTQSGALPFLLSLEDDSVELRTRMDIISEIVIRSGTKPLKVPYLGKSYLAKVVSMLYQLDYATYFASILRGVDPIGTPSIDFLKRELHSRLDYLKRFS